MSGLHLNLLGSPEIELDGQALGFDTRKAIALFAYLALTGKNHNRDALAVLFWPEYDQSSSRAALRRTLSTLKKPFPTGPLIVKRDSIGIDPDLPLTVDVLVIEALLDGRREHGHAESENGNCLSEYWSRDSKLLTSHSANGP